VNEFPPQPDLEDLMTRRSVFPLLALAIVTTTTAFSTTAVKKSPPWISIEAPVNPYDRETRGAVMAIHATFREGDSQLSDLSGTAEGLVGGGRRSIPLRFEATSHSNIYVLRRQWPTEGAWLTRINLKTTTAIVTLDQSGNVSAVRVPTEVTNGMPLPRPVSAKEIDSTLAAVARR
jgi:hypothetical protein